MKTTCLLCARCWPTDGVPGSDAREITPADVVPVAGSPEAVRRIGSRLSALRPALAAKGFGAQSRIHASSSRASLAVDPCERLSNAAIAAMSSGTAGLSQPSTV